MDDLTGDSPTIASTLSGAGGMVAGRYRVRARLGRGATKEVYLAYDERLDREVALAIVVGAGSDVARARVAREAQVTGRLGDHPNVITVYDTGELDGVPYLVLRAMGGGSLADGARARAADASPTRCGSAARSPPRWPTRTPTTSCTATSSPTTSGSPPTAAPRSATSASRTSPGADRLTAEGVVVGTVRYLSPEQIRGERRSARERPLRARRHALRARHRAPAVHGRRSRAACSPST